MQFSVGLYYRARVGSNYPYLKPAISGNGRIRPGYAIYQGKTVHAPGGQYFLRVSTDAKRSWEPIGSDSSLAFDRLRRRRHELDADALGFKVSGEPPVSSTLPATIPTKRSFGECVRSYLAEIEAHKSQRTLAAYTHTLMSFMEAIQPDHIEEISREDLLRYVTALKKIENAPRTVRNRIDYMQIFMHHFGLPSLLKGKDLPKFTEKKVRAYNATELDSMFRAATDDEHDLLLFAFCTGTREQEIQFSTWPDFDAVAATYSVTEHLELGFTPKDSEEGILPVAKPLVERMKARRLRYASSRLIFPAKCGKPDGHLLRILKRLALRAGVNCGQCVSRNGKSCSNHPVCKKFILHTMRKTYATHLHRSGVPARDLMRLLRHSSIETTLRYLAADEEPQVRKVMDKAFESF